MSLVFKALLKSTSSSSQFARIAASSNSVLLMQRKFESTYKTILTEVKGQNKNIGFIQLNRPKALNALNPELMNELGDAVGKFDNDPAIRCLILTGSTRAFAAGADIKDMLDKSFGDVVNGNFLGNWTSLSEAKMPIIAAVNGYALGGGCELAMMCDIILAGEKAEFGQPEIVIGTIPGAGGTQRWPRFVGKSKAMEICLTGDRISARDAHLFGLVSAVHPADKLVDEAMKLAERIATHSRFTTRLVKEAVNVSFETTMTTGLSYERRLFHSTFASNDRKEGMSAFVEKRKPKFTDS